MTDHDAAPKHVVIVGAGFAGLHCARQLASKQDVSITLIDRHNYQQFQPLLYQVATGILPPDDAAFNVRDVFRNDACVAVVMAEIGSVDLKAKTVTTTTGVGYSADALVLAVGAEVNFFGVPGAKDFAFPMYSLQDAEQIRSRLLESLEEANATVGSETATDLHFLVVGGGPTGVETAGAISDVIRRIPKHLYPNVDFAHVAVSLIDAGDRILSPFSRKSQDYAKNILAERGVRVRLGLSVREVTASDVLLSDGSRVTASAVVWAGGLQASALSHSLGIALGHGSRADVASDLTLTGCDGVYALGDFANVTGNDGMPLPQLASVAQQAGTHCANNILADFAAQPRTPFAYVDRGIMAMVGRNAALAELGPKRRPIAGVLAFFAWLAVHATLMTSARARVATVFEWSWNFFGGVRVNPILDRPSAQRPSSNAERKEI